MPAPRFVLDEFWPSDLFLGGIPGAWYDPTDLSTMFQDSAGTTPVTAVEQPVGLIQDKSGNANHATQATAASRPTYRARYNLLTQSEDFSQAVWQNASGTVSTNAAVAPDGTTTADLVYPAATGSYRGRYQTFAPVSGQYTTSIYFKASGKTFVGLFDYQGGSPSGWVDLTSGAVSGVVGGYTITATSVGNGWFRCVMTATPTIGPTRYVQFFAADAAGSATATVNGTDGILAWGAQLLTAADVTATGNAYQRIAAATVYDTAPIFRPYLAFDGLDDSLATAAIDFTSTDKMTTFAGLSKLSNATAAIFAELSANFNLNNGTFALVAPNGVGAVADYAAASRGAAAPAVNQFASSVTTLAPVTHVWTTTHDIPGDLSALRLNGAANGTNGTGDKGAGTFGNYAMFIGRRGGTTLPFNGRLYSLIVRGAASSTTEIIDTETWVNQRTGGY